MKSIKKLFGIALALIIAMSVFAVPATVSAASEEIHTMKQYTSFEDFIKSENEDETFESTVTNNKGETIKTDCFAVSEGYWVSVSAKKLTTESTMPVVTVYKVKGTEKTEYKKYKFKITKVTKVKQSDVKINKGVWSKIIVKDPYDNKAHKLSYNKKIVKIKTGYYGDGEG